MEKILHILWENIIYTGIIQKVIFPLPYKEVKHTEMFHILYDIRSIVIVTLSIA